MSIPSAQRLQSFAAVLAVCAAACAPGEEPAAAETPPVAGSPPALNQRSPAAPIRFSIGRWLDATGAQRSEVEGRFTALEFALPTACAAPDCLVGARGTVTVDLRSLDTALPARDQNIEAAYFETGSYPTAQAAFQLKSVEAMDGDGFRALVSLALTLRGITANLADTTLELHPSASGTRVRTTSPIEVHSDTFAMPVAALLAVCGHLGIDPVARVELDAVVPFTLPGPAR